MSLRRLQDSSEERIVDVNSLWNVDIRGLQYVWTQLHTCLLPSDYTPERLVWVVQVASRFTQFAITSSTNAGWASFSSRTHVSSMEKRLIHEKIINSKNTTLVILSTYLGPGIWPFTLFCTNTQYYWNLVALSLLEHLLDVLFVKSPGFSGELSELDRDNVVTVFSVTRPRSRVQVLRKACITKSRGWWSTSDFADKYQYSFERRRCGVCSVRLKRASFQPWAILLCRA